MDVIYCARASYHSDHRYGCSLTYFVFFGVTAGEVLRDHCCLKRRCTCHCRVFIFFGNNIAPLTPAIVKALYLLCAWCRQFANEDPPSNDVAHKTYSRNIPVTTRIAVGRSVDRLHTTARAERTTSTSAESQSSCSGRLSSFTRRRKPRGCSSCTRAPSVSSGHKTTAVLSRRKISFAP